MNGTEPETRPQPVIEGPWPRQQVPSWQNDVKVIKILLTIMFIAGMAWFAASVIIACMILHDMNTLSFPPSQTAGSICDPTAMFC